MSVKATVFWGMLLVVDFILFAGLPDQVAKPSAIVDSRPEPAHIWTLIGDTGHSSDAQGVESLKRDYVRLQQEVSMLKQALNQHNGAFWPSSQSNEAGDGESSPGVTVYLETSRSVSSGAGNEWTAVSIKDAGRAKDGSKQAVLSIDRITPRNGGSGVDAHIHKSYWQ